MFIDQVKNTCDAACIAAQDAQDHSMGVFFAGFFLLVVGVGLTIFGFQKVIIYPNDDEFEIKRKRNLVMLSRIVGMIMALLPLSKIALYLWQG